MFCASVAEYLAIEFDRKNDIERVNNNINFLMNAIHLQIVHVHYSQYTYYARYLSITEKKLI